MNDKTDKTLYVAVPLGKIVPDSKLVTDIYLKINENFIKYKERDDELPVEKYDLFISKNVKEIFLHKDDFPFFMDWLTEAKQQIVDEITEKVGEEHRELVEQREQIKEIIFETFAEEALSSKNVQILQDQTKQFIEQVKEQKVPQAVLAKLTSHSPSIADHSVNVANIAVYLGMVLGHGHSFTLECLYLGGIFHDYGKAKIPANILEDKSHVLYDQRMKEHPTLGVKLLKKVPDIPEQVLMMVEQHHEQYNGKGYPQGLKGDQIFELAKILTMANFFDNAVIDNRNKPKEMYRIACKAVEYDRGVNFDPLMLERVVDGLKLAFGGYTD